MEKWQTIILDIASAWPDTGSWTKDSQWCGRTFYPERLKDMGVGMFVASMYSIIAWVIDSFLPWWVGVLVLVWLAWLRSRSVKTVLDKHRAATPWYSFNQSLWSTLLLCEYTATSSRWRITFDVGICHFVFGWALAWFQDAHSDGPPGWLRLRATAQWDAAIGYLALNCLISDACRNYPWTRPIAAVYFCTIVLYLLRAHLPERFWGSLSTSRRRTYALAFFGWLDAMRDWCGVFEAVLMHIPLLIQAERCRQEQRSRSGGETARFQYTALKDGEIRLLRLSKATQLIPGTIKAQLIHETLSAELKYEALSYRWGPATRTAEIIIDGKIFAVTESAFELLLARRSYHERLVWIDAICINQDDDTEKSRQVQLMHQIYRAATRVIMFPRFNEDARMAAGAVYELGLSETSGDDEKLSHMRGLRSPLLPPFRPIASRWKALVDLLAQEYFSRAWIVQEVVAGKEVQLFLGGHYVSWDTFAIAAGRLLKPETLNLLIGIRRMSHPTEDPSSTIRIGNILHMHTMRADSRHRTNAAWRSHVEVRGLMSILFMMREFQASDPRDKIFGILGLVKEKDLSRGNDESRHLYPVVDYSKSIEDVLLDTSRRLLLHDQPCPIDLLALAGNGWPEMMTPGPSWTIKFPGTKTFMRFTDWLTRKPRFRAGGHAPADVRSSRKLEGIEIKGVVHDSIFAINDSRLIALDTSTRTNMRYLLDFIDTAKEFVQRHSSNLSTNADLLSLFLIGRSRQHANVDLSEWQVNMREHLADVDRIEATGGQYRDPGQRYSGFFSQSGIMAITMIVIHSCAGRAIAITRSGRLCLVPPGAVVGDLVWLPCGAQAPYIIHFAGRDDEYQLVGESYVQGIMKGEAMDESKASYITLV